MTLTNEGRIGLESPLRKDDYDGSVSARAQIVLWRADGYSAQDIAEMAGTTSPTVYKWIKRYGTDGLTDRKSTGRPPDISARVRAMILALTRRSPPSVQLTEQLIVLIEDRPAPSEHRQCIKR